ncbi:MAG: hypothetical protein AAFX50_25025, partial [Acidobacteriota bacterium]
RRKIEPGRHRGADVMSGAGNYPAVVGACRHRSDSDLWLVATLIGLPPVRTEATSTGHPCWRGEFGILRLIATAASTPRAAEHLRKIADVDDAAAYDWCRRFRWHVHTGRIWLPEAA